MTCCTGPCAVASHFNPKKADRDLRRYQRHGPDISTLDRVVCCYPDVEALLRGAAARARRIVAFTYPRDEWYVRAGFVVENSWYRLRQDPFRAFVHSPQRMASVLESAGFVRAARLAKLQWALDLYRRA